MRSSLRLRPLLLLPALSALLFAGPVSCSRSVSNAEMRIEEEKRDKLLLEVRKMDTENKGLKSEKQELKKNYGGSEHLQKIKQIDALKKEIADLQIIKVEVAEKVTRFTDGVKAHRAYLSSQEQ